jgi:hypothetical protein
LARLEAVIDEAGVALAIEALLPTGVRPRQLEVRTLLIGIIACQADGRPAHLTRVLAALQELTDADRRRLRIVVEWKHGPHALTYRQVERTLSVVVGALEREEPDGSPSLLLQQIVDALLEASIRPEHKDISSSYAVDWSDIESSSRPPLEKGGPCADLEASWGHRRGDGPGERDELFFGYYFQLATMVKDEHGPAVPELVRRMCVTSCRIDPPPVFVGVLADMAATGVEIGDVLSDSGYAHRTAGHWALPLRALGARLVQDLHPHDRGMRGTHEGAICFNGNLYCPATPVGLFGLEPLSRSASASETAEHDLRSAELSRYKLGRLTCDDADGYHRVACPAVLEKVRCPLRQASMALSYDRPEILAPPEHPTRCCCQQTITVPPQVNAKTAQKHDYPSKAHRRSYARRAAAERSNSTVKDRATTDVSRGWCRLMGVTAISLFLACLIVARNERILTAFSARQDDEARRRTAGLPPRVRARRRRGIEDIVASANAPP